MSGPQLKIKNQIMAKRSSKIGENFVSNPQLNMVQQTIYGITMEPKKKSFAEPAESCPH